MKTVKGEIENEIIINKSRFITVITPVFNQNDIIEKLNEIKKKYKDATHYCYAYIINSSEKCSDDGEPSGTAGIPILNVLKKNNLTNVLCIVIRYFGGIKLGAGGLVRAYSNSVSEALNKCSIGKIEEGYLITIEFDYDNVKSIDYILNNIKLKKSYDEKIIYEFKIEKTEYEKIENSLLKISRIKNKKEINIIKDEN